MKVGRATIVLFLLIIVWWLFLRQTRSQQAEKSASTVGGYSVASTYNEQFNT
jgi:hypothetical protein